MMLKVENRVARWLIKVFYAVVWIIAKTANVFDCIAALVGRHSWSVVRGCCLFLGLFGIEAVLETSHLIPVTLLPAEIYLSRPDCLFWQMLIGWPFITNLLVLVPLKDPRHHDPSRNQHIWTYTVIVAWLLIEYYVGHELFFSLS